MQLSVYQKRMEHVVLGLEEASEGLGEAEQQLTDAGTQMCRLLTELQQLAALVEAEPSAPPALKARLQQSLEQSMAEATTVLSSLSGASRAAMQVTSAHKRMHTHSHGALEDDELGSKSGSTHEVLRCESLLSPGKNTRTWFESPPSPQPQNPLLHLQPADPYPPLPAHPPRVLMHPLRLEAELRELEASRQAEQRASKQRIAEVRATPVSHPPPTNALSSCRPSSLTSVQPGEVLPHPDLMPTPPFPPPVQLEQQASKWMEAAAHQNGAGSASRSPAEPSPSNQAVRPGALAAGCCLHKWLREGRSTSGVFNASHSPSPSASASAATGANPLDLSQILPPALFP